MPTQKTVLESTKIQSSRLHHYQARRINRSNLPVMTDSPGVVWEVMFCKRTKENWNAWSAVHLSLHHYATYATKQEAVDRIIQAIKADNSRPWRAAIIIASLVSLALAGLFTWLY